MNEKHAPATMIGCPACAGVLAEKPLPESQKAYFECTVGHKFSHESLLEAKEEQTEQALWSALVLLAHLDMVATRLIDQLESPAFERRKAELLRRREQVRRQATQLRAMVEETVRPNLGVPASQ
jgi:two-component system chemotaxis response regulator CheB